MKKTKFIWTFLPIFLTTILVTNLINNRIVNIEKNKAKSNLSNDINIINDINSDYWIKDNQIKSKIKLTVRTMKELWVLSTYRVNHKIWYQTYDYENISTPIFDKVSKKIIFDTWNKPVSQLFSDPDPYWADPVGAKWNNKLLNINIYGRNDQYSPNIKDAWFGKNHYNNFELNDKNVHKPKIFPAYPPHNYFSHVIRYYQTPSYVHNNVSKKIEFFEITNKSFFNTFIELSKIPFDQNGKVWNKDNYNEMGNLIKFNHYFHIAREISKVYKVVENINNFIDKNTNKDGKWINQIIKKSDLISLKNDFETWKFASADEAWMRYNSLIDINNSKLILTTSSYESQYNKLIKNIYKNNLISVDRKITIDDINEIYKTSLAIFKQNQINLSLNINGEIIKYNIWDGRSFIKIWNNLLSINKNKNLLNISIENVEFKYIGDHNKTGYFNNSYIIKKEEISNELKSNTTLIIRNDAKNLDNIDLLNNNNFGINIDSDLYLSELLGTGENIGNGYPYNEVIFDKKLLIKNLLNNNFILSNKEMLFKDVYDISNLTKILNFFDDKKTRESFNSFGINTGRYPYFIPNNQKGEFYLIGKIEKWKFIDQTNGDFTQNFKNTFFEKTNINSLNIIELEPKNRLVNNLWDDSGYFLIKCKNNFITNSSISVNNTVGIFKQTDAFITYLNDDKNWILKNDDIIEDYFLYQKKFKRENFKINYNQLSEEEINKIDYLIKELKIEVEFSNQSLYTPVDSKYPSGNMNRYNTFFNFFFKTPIWKYINSYYNDVHNVQLVNQVALVNKDNIENKIIEPNAIFFKYFDIIEKNNHVTISDKNDVNSTNIIKSFIPIKELATNGELEIKNNAYLIDLKINKMEYINGEVNKYNEQHITDYSINVNYGNIFIIVGPILGIGIIILILFLINKWRNRFETKLKTLNNDDIIVEY